MFGVHRVEQRKRICDEGRLGRRARAAAVAAIVQQVEGVIRKRAGQARQAVRDILRVAAEIDQRALGLAVLGEALQRTSGDDQLGAVHRQGLTQDLHAKGALIYFGGNAEDVSYSLPGLANAFPDHAVYLLHYRGYGGSTGTPSEAAIIKDALTLFDKVHAEHKNIVVVGRSLGSGVAVQLASQRPVARLVLVTPYDSIAEIAARQFPVFPVRWLLRDKFESYKYAPQITVPTLIIAAEHDEVIPRASTDALFNSFRARVAVFKVIARTGHNTISDSPEYIPLLTGA